MSQASIRAALETALASITSEDFPTAYENISFTPPATTVPYQACYVRFATPENVERGGGFNDIGFFQVSLFYPRGDGSADASARAEVIRSLFKKRASFIYGDVTVSVTKTPEIQPGTETPEIQPGTDDGERWAVSIRVPFMAQVYS